MKTTVLISSFIIFFFWGNIVVVAQATDDPCKTTASAETGLYTSNVWAEVGEEYENAPSIQSYLEVMGCKRNGAKKIRFGVSLWNALSTRTNPGPGTEVDALGVVVVETDNVTVRGEAGTFEYLKGERAYVAKVTVLKPFSVSKRIDGEFFNSTGFYKTNIEDLKGGIVNKTGVTLSGSLRNEKFNWSVQPSIGVDNNLFNLGHGKVVAMGFLKGRADVPLNKRIGLYFQGELSAPIVGDTDRRFRKVAAIGLTIQIR